MNDTVAPWLLPIDRKSMTSGKHVSRIPSKPDDANGKESGMQNRAISLGTNLAAGMAVFCLLGYWIDKWRGGNGTGVWMLAGMLMGLVYGGYEVWKVVRMIDADSKDPVKSRSEGKQG